MVPLMTPLETHDAYASVDGIAWPKRSCCTLFQLSWPKELNGGIDDAIGVTSC